MCAKLSDKQKKSIVADRADGLSGRELARKYHVSETTIRRVLSADKHTAEKIAQKKAQNTADIFAYMEGKRDVVNEIINKGLTVLNSEEKLAAASPAQITTALGTLIDKFTAIPETAYSDGLYELPARVIGRAFVDINRQIAPNGTYIFDGGRGGLKSSYVSLKIVELIKNNPQMHACIVRKIAVTLKDSVYAQMQWAISTLGLDAEFRFTKSPLEITYTKTGQKIYFRGVDEPTKLKGIKTSFGYIGILWKEELDQLAGPEEMRSVNQSVLRGGAESYDFASYNPPKSRAAWVNKMIPDERTVVHHSTYLDAPAEWLGQKFLDDAEHLKETNPAAYAHEYMGDPNGDGGGVFDNIETRAITDAEVASFDRIYQGVDWGWFPDPFAFIRVHYDHARETIYFIDEIYVNKTPNDQTAKIIRERGYAGDVTTCDSAEPKSIADYRAAGINAKTAKKGPGSVDYGMKWLQARKLVIDPARTPEAWREFTSYEYERDKNGEFFTGYPDENNHLIDALRYALERVQNRYGVSA